MTEADGRQEEWRRYLSAPYVNFETRTFRHLPSDPRCLLCHAPYGRPWGPILGSLGYGRSERYPQLCKPCFRHLSKHPGGAEVTITVLVADVRGSTGIAEQQSPEEFRGVLESFYRLTTDAVTEQQGIVDKFLGDGVMALFIPSFTDMADAAHAVAAGRQILAEAALPIGVGVNTGPAFTGFIGPSADVASFTAVGDAVNVAHRLGEAATAGEMLVARATIDAANLAPLPGEDPWPTRSFQVKGREQAVDALSLR